MAASPKAFAASMRLPRGGAKFTQRQKATSPHKVEALWFLMDA